MYLTVSPYFLVYILEKQVYAFIFGSMMYLRNILCVFWCRRLLPSGKEWVFVIVGPGLVTRLLTSYTVLHEHLFSG